jgi:site-specific recombinase XerD
MVEQDYSLPEVQAMLGHRNLATTSIYLHVRDARLAERVKTAKGIDDRPASALKET